MDSQPGSSQPTKSGGPQEPGAGRLVMCLGEEDARRRPRRADGRSLFAAMTQPRLSKWHKRARPSDSGNAGKRAVASESMLGDARAGRTGLVSVRSATRAKPSAIITRCGTLRSKLRLVFLRYAQSMSSDRWVRTGRRSRTIRLDQPKHRSIANADVTRLYGDEIHAGQFEGKVIDNSAH